MNSVIVIGREAGTGLFYKLLALHLAASVVLLLLQLTLKRRLMRTGRDFR
jgi:hypothetical protein